jgi:uncharacterized protein (DUF1810 family)
MADLTRFRHAQDAAHGGYATALAELRAGRKRSHWIWYVFPQLAGLGRSSTATYYGLAGVDEARAYLRDPVLGARLLTATAVVREHLTAPAPPRLDRLMGAEIDALKLVSCMTLFARVARPDVPAMAEHAEAILGIAAAQGYPRCAFTERALGGLP